MARSKTSWQTKDTIKWKRKVMKMKGKWRYRLWTWGSADPAPLETSHEKFSTAKEVKSRVVELILSEEPNITLTRKSKFGII